MACFVLADRLHKTLDEISSMTLQEFDYWFVYMQLQREATINQQQKRK